MKKIFTIALLCSFFSVLAQHQSVSGTVKPAQPYYNVLLHVAGKNAFFKAALTNDQGRFVFTQIPPGEYFIKITAPGWLDYQSAVFRVGQNPVELPAAVLIEKVNQLNEITVKAKKPMIQVLADKTVFNVQNTLNATGTSGFELLRKAPGVIIDNNDGLILEGKSGVLIYIDGKQSYLTGADLTNFLKTIQASDVDSIEIITQPSSKYDAAGNAGIINIKLKKNKNFGTNGTASTGTNVGRYATSVNSLSLNNRNKKNNLYGNYSNRLGANKDFINIHREQSNTIFDSRSRTKNEVNANNLKLGYDYYANARNTFGMMVSGNFNNSFSNARTRTPIMRMNSAVYDSILVAQNNDHHRTYNLYSNINYKYADTSGVSLNLDLDYGKYGSKKEVNQPNTYLASDEQTILNQNISYQNTPTYIDIATFKTDYEQRFWKGVLGFGVKTSWVKTDNTLDFYNVIGSDYQLNPNRSNHFVYEENVNAAYVNFNRTIRKFNFQLGIRLENTNSDGMLDALVTNNNQRVKRHYTDWFPSGGITYNMTQKHAFALTYSRRIERPNYQSLNPFEYQIDELSFMRGNPFLKPQYTNNFKLSHTYNYALNTSLSYTRVSDFFAQVIEASGTSRSFLTSRNVATEEVINLGVSYPFDVRKWWNVYLSLNAYKSMYTATNDSFNSISQETLNIYGQNTFKLPSNISLEVSGWFNSPSVWGGTFRTSSIGSLDMAFQKQFLNKKLTARLAFSDILYTSPWKGRTRYAFVNIIGDGGQDSRQVRFNLSYKFGNDAVKKSRQRETGLEDEKNRISR